MEPENKSQSLVSKIVSIVIALLAVVGVMTYLSQNKKEEVTSLEQQEVAVQPKEEQTSSQTTKTSAGETPLPSSIYKDGTYKATGTYTSPGGTETIDISLTITGDTVSAATFKGNAELPASKNWQGKFSQGFEQAVVGKDIDTLSLTIVNGSSLTPKGFMDALATIKKEAKL